MALKRESINVATLEFVLKLEKCTYLQVILFEEPLYLAAHLEWDVLGAERVGGQKILGHGRLRGLPESLDIGEASGGGYGSLEH
jgi:hypothetical protein